MKTSALMILTTKRGFAADPRVRKETEALVSRGHQIYLLSGSPKELPGFQNIDGVHVYRIKLLRSKPALLSIIVNHLKLFLCLVRRIAEHRAPIIHVHDLHYALIITITGRFFRKKVIYDAHEDYVGMIREQLERNGFLRRMYFRIFLAYYFLSEILVCRFSTRIIVVIEENRNRLIKLNIPSEKIVIISNTPDINRLKDLTISFQKTCKKTVISYVGGFSHLRGLDILIQALPSIVRKNPETSLLLVGNGGNYSNSLVTLGKQLGVERKVTFTGWVSFEKAMKYLQKSDIGVIPHRSCRHTDNTVPHKLFQYMFYKKPLVVSDVKPLKRIVTTIGCGRTFQAGDHKGLARTLLEVIGNPSEQTEMGRKGRKAVENIYNWNLEQKKLLSIYEKMV